MDALSKPAGDPGVGSGIPDATSLESMSKDQLLSYAKEIGAKADFSMKKADIMQAIMDKGGHVETGSSTVPEDPPDPSLAGPPEEEGDHDKTDDTPIGTIRILEGVEKVKVNGTDWVPVIRVGIPSNRPVVMSSPRRAGKTIYAKTGKPITFDEQGRATVDMEDWAYLKNLPDFFIALGTESES
jgi:hypothetical protein